MENLERGFTLIISFLIVVIISVWVEKGINLININQKRPTSPLKKHKDHPNLTQFVKRYFAISLRYLELIIIAFLGLLLEWGIRSGVQKTEFKFIFPIIVMLIPVSFLTITLAVPKESKDFFSPYWYEGILSGLLFFGGLFWLLFMLNLP